MLVFEGTLPHQLRTDHLINYILYFEKQLQPNIFTRLLKESILTYRNSSDATTKHFWKRKNSETMIQKILSLQNNLKFSFRSIVTQNLIQILMNFFEQLLKNYIHQRHLNFKKIILHSNTFSLAKCFLHDFTMLHTIHRFSMRLFE